MVIIQFTGLSGAGKSTIADLTKQRLQSMGLPVEVIDGDQYRKTICNDLGFSKADRCENIRRLGRVAHAFSREKIITILAAINPYAEIRRELSLQYQAKTVYIDCPLDTLFRRDTKGLYQRSLLPDEHPDKLFHLTGIDDPYEIPDDADLVLHTHHEPPEVSVGKLCDFILAILEPALKIPPMI